ncbi:MAG: DNA-protecting protein DprA [Cyanobacteria bacterium SZAS LIN-5]|nr:DNA-protecting protein DprA [Cyanobacteria bacterium SZAS LIN-5]
MSSGPMNVDDDLWTDNEQAHWLAFDQLSGPGLGVTRIKRLFQELHSLAEAWTASRDQLRSLDILKLDVIDAFIEKRKSIDPAALLEKVRKENIQVYPLYHPVYPMRLREIHDPPVVLYVNGRLTPDDMIYAVGVVGTRRPTSYGTKYAKEISRNLARAGATIVSGMAVGVDSLAHWGAIEGGGRTVAVLGCGPDVCYPSGNRPLFKSLVSGEHGAVVSEFFPGTRPEPWRFPARNRIISGLSKGLAVIEAGETSGSLITAKIAFEQNREVFALPGRVDNPMSRGTNKLISAQTAHVLTSHEDILNELSWTSAPSNGPIPVVVELFGKEKEVFELISAEPVHFDHLIERSGLHSGELSATLTMLELAGVVERLPGDWYSRQTTSFMSK